MPAPSSHAASTSAAPALNGTGASRSPLSTMAGWPVLPSVQSSHATRPGIGCATNPAPSRAQPPPVERQVLDHLVDRFAGAVQHGKGRAVAAVVIDDGAFDPRAAGHRWTASRSIHAHAVVRLLLGGPDHPRHAYWLAVEQVGSLNGVAVPPTLQRHRRAPPARQQPRAARATASLPGTNTTTRSPRASNRQSTGCPS